MSRLVCLLMLAGAALAQTESVVVQLEQGPVRGYKDAQGDFYSFLDVPYATAPIGTNKFKAPLPPPVWTEPFDAVERRIVCPQSSMAIGPVDTSTVTMQEDCLVANIFVPDTNATNLPVLVSVHGGAYLVGSGWSEDYTSLIRMKKTIVITFNYRLSIIGFLCLGTNDVPGNAGMKDQVALLRWVKTNVASFGGNPDDVTVAGCSAGGGAVDFLTLSPMTTGLFNKAILGSGAVFGGTGTQVDPVQNAKIYAKQLNFSDIDDLNALEEFYKTASLDFLMSEEYYLHDATEIHAGSILLFTPCLERVTKDESFLTDTPENILKNGNYHKMPLLYGFAEMEGLLRLPKFDEWKDLMNIKFSDFLPSDLYFENDEEKEEVASRAKEFYFGNDIVSEETMLAYINYFSDLLFVYPMMKASNMRRASLGDTMYLFQYSFVDQNSPTILGTNLRGANHCSQADAVIDTDIMNASEEYLAMKAIMREVWINFITTGNPIAEDSSLPSWPAVSGVNSPYMLVNSTSLLKITPLLEERISFWNSIYEKHYLAPVPPVTAGTASFAAASFKKALISFLLSISLFFFFSHAGA